MKIKLFLKQRYPVILICLLVIAVISIYKPAYKKVGDVVLKNNTEQSDEATTFSRILDGVTVSDASMINPAVTAIMIENNIESWPLVGLDKASVVYEALAEGRIPRFMALYPYGTEVEKIGPVRSARPYYLELASPFEALYMHVGGSPDALAYLKKLPLTDADQFFWSEHYWRSKDRSAPHNVYTSSELIKSLYESREKETIHDFSGWKFSNDEVTNVVEYPFDITINYTTSTYQAKYIYNKETKQYQRYQAKEPMKLQDGSLIYTDTVIIEEHAHQVLDAVGRRDIEMIGSGKAWIFNQGAYQEVTWKKDSPEMLTRYYTIQNEEVTLRPGKIWIQIVEKDLFELTSLEKIAQ